MAAMIPNRGLEGVEHNRIFVTLCDYGGCDARSGGMVFDSGKHNQCVCRGGKKEFDLGRSSQRRWCVSHDCRFIIYRKHHFWW